MKRLGSALYRRRRQLMLSQEEAAELIGVPRRTYGRWERGEHEAHPGNRRKLAAFLGKPVPERR